MKTTTKEDKIDEMLTVLDKDIQHMQENLARLNELRSLVIKRDNASLGRLLESIQNDADSYAANEAKRNAIRRQLSAALDCAFDKLTLSRLETVVSEDKKNRIAEIKTGLKSLAEELKKEYLGTVMLLSECARFNNLLLKSIFGFGKTGTTMYGSSGEAKRQTDAAFVNVRS
jgi:hypothetical protein